MIQIFLDKHKVKELIIASSPKLIMCINMFFSNLPLRSGKIGSGKNAIINRFCSILLFYKSTCDRYLLTKVGFAKIGCQPILLYSTLLQKYMRSLFTN
jgi:hypothetical protein